MRGSIPIRTARFIDADDRETFHQHLRAHRVAFCREEKLSLPGVLDPEERFDVYLRADTREWGRYAARFGTHLVQVRPAAGATFERIGVQKIAAINEMPAPGSRTRSRQARPSEPSAERSVPAIPPFD